MKPRHYYEYERLEVLEAIPLDAARILDVGCGSGRLGEQVKQRQGATVWGIEMVREVAELATQRLDRVWNTSVEQALADIPDGTLDCIVTADVLEHLVDPWTVLTALRQKLVSGGTVVASIPNVGHWDVIRDLIEGNWRYTSEGLLDRTHLRFFTRRSVQELFWTAGLVIRELTTIIPDSAGVPAPLVAAFRGAGLRVAGLVEDGQVFQYRVVAERRELPGTWPRVGIVVLCEGENGDTLRCLESIQRLTYAPVETVVVDNGSFHGSVDGIRARFPGVTTLEAGGNIASLACSNPGIRHALESGAEYVLILSNEMVVDESFLTRLMQTAVMTPEAGLWGSRICYQSFPDTVWATGRNWHPGRLDFLMQGKGESAADPVHAVDALMGCAMLIRRDVFERVGLFAAEYRRSWGEIDFCTRAAQHGFTCAVVPAALMSHATATPDGEERSVVREYFDTRNRLLWGRRYLRRPQLRDLRRQVLRELWTTLPRVSGRTRGLRKFYWWALAIIRESNDPFMRARRRALLDHLLWRSGDCPQAVLRFAAAQLSRKTGPPTTRH